MEEEGKVLLYASQNWEGVQCEAEKFLLENTGKQLKIWGRGMQ